MRSTRNQPFCWQEKKVYRILRNHYSGNELVKLRCLYGAITEADSDFNSKDIKYYTKTIHTYSGLSKDWIPTGLKILQGLRVLRIVEDKEKGKFKGKRLQFTPENIKEMPLKTVAGKPSNGKPVDGKNDTSEDISLSEDSNCSEDNNYTNLNEIIKEEETIEHVKLKETEYHRLIRDYGKETIVSYILKLENYIAEDKKRIKVYKSRDHNRTIRNWLNRADVKKLPPRKTCPDCKTELKPGGLCPKCNYYPGPGR